MRKLQPTGGSQIRFLTFFLVCAAAGCAEPSGDGPGVEIPGGKADSPATGPLVDVTEQWTYNGVVVSAFPRIYEEMPMGEDNAELTKVYHVPVDAFYPARRVEAFLTHGDCGQALFLTTDIDQFRFDENGDPMFYSSGEPRRFFDKPRAYYVEKYSSYDDVECGAREYDARFIHNTERFIDFSDTELMEFVANVFIGDDSMVNPSFEPMCIGGNESSGSERPCISAEAIGDIGG